MNESTATPTDLIDELRASNQHGDGCAQCVKAHAVADAYEALAATLAEALDITADALSDADDYGVGWDAEVSASSLHEVLSKLPADALAARDARVLREAAERVRAEARRSADAQRAHDDAEGIKPIGTSTANEVEWHQMGNWAHRILTADADRIEREAAA